VKLPRIEWQWAVTTAVAMYGASLSTYNAYVARKQNRRQIRVTMSYGFLTFGPNLSDQMLILNASNPGQRDLSLTGVGILLPTKQQLAILSEGSSPLPHHLTQGTSITHWTPVQEMKRMLRDRNFPGTVNVTAYYSDAVGARHYSKPLSFDIEGK
jgi:hypothetical protein